jgi:hypothetical protein
MYAGLKSWCCGALLAIATVALGDPQSDALTQFKEELAPATVYKSATCGCCNAWVEHLKAAGFNVRVHDVDNLAAIKERVGIPYGMGSCHTAQIGDYFIEGHVPASDIRRLLQEKPKAKGLTVPGMPIGSPGMESVAREIQDYEVYLVGTDGQTTVFSKHP